MLVRTAKCISGQVDIMMDCMPLFDYARTAGSWEYAGSGYGAATCLADGQPSLTVSSNLNLGIGGARATARKTLHEGRVRLRCALLV